MKFAKPLLTVLLSLTTLNAVARESEGGAHGGGGGDMESEFKTIASNINDWIASGGAAALTLPANLSRASYRQKMQKEISSYQIEMVSQTLTFGGGVKTCVSAKIQGKNRIRCNQSLFRDTVTNNVDGAYRLVHHEFAGLALIERNQGSNSDYRVSDQISKFLENQIVRRLPVGDLNRYSNPPTLKTITCGRAWVFQAYNAPGALDDAKWTQFKSQISPADYVRWLVKTKNPTFMAGLTKTGADLSVEPLTVGKPVPMEGGGRVENYSTTYLVPMNFSEKRDEGVRVYVRVTAISETLVLPEQARPYAPTADSINSLRLDGIFDPSNPKNAVEFEDPFMDSKKPISQLCHNVTIAVDHSDSESN